MCFVAALGLSSHAYSACSFDTTVDTPPDGVSDLSGQGNFTCADFIGSNGQPMTEVIGVVFQKNGDWDLPESAYITTGTGAATRVLNTPDHVVLFPQGQGSRCAYSYFRTNAVSGRGLDIEGNVDTSDSIACTDMLTNVDEVILPPPDIVLTTGDGCDVTLTASTPNGEVDETDFDVFIGMNLDGTKQAICNNGGIVQHECVKTCPKFRNIEALQDAGFCDSDTAGWIPLEDTEIPDDFDEYVGDKRCTPCLTAEEAELEIAGFDSGGLDLCWQYTNSVDNVDKRPGFYRPHKKVRSQVTETVFYNECYETETTVTFFGREIKKTITVCD